MASQTSKGECVYCKRTFSKAGISRHLASCAARKATVAAPSDKQPEAMLHLRLEGEYLPMYWMNIEVSAQLQLGVLDDFIRDIWVECCGHLSMFTIDGQEYMSQVFEYGEHDMRANLSNCFKSGTIARYIYDFGSSTELLVKYIDERRGVPLEDITIMARNFAPEMTCTVCGQPAKELCTMCMWTGNGAFCDAHAADHECGEEMLLPIVNSPRVGTCGYVGDYYD